MQGVSRIEQSRERSADSAMSVEEAASASMRAPLWDEEDAGRDESFEEG